MAHRILFTKRADRDYADVPKGPIRELDKILVSGSWRVVYHVDARAAEVTIARIFPRALGYERALRGLK